MKSFFTFFITFVLGSSLFGQGFHIDEAPRALNSGTYYSFLFELPDVSKQEADQEWQKFMSDFKGKSKYNKRSKIWFTDNAKMPRLSTTAVDVYAKIMEDSNPGKRTSVIVWFDLGSSYVNAEDFPEQTSFARKILTEYAMTTSRHHAAAIVKAEEKQLKDLEAKKKKLVKDNTDYRKEIEKAKTLIAKRTKDLEINEADQTATEEAIQMQKKTVAVAKKYEQQFN